jgi:NAD(P)-dependent dehydrogenase (short-subunit alcohol dehydrogenase family)
VFDALFASDVRAPYLLVGALAPEMAERGNGSIINISSMGAKVDLPGAAAYSPTKGAIEALTRSWAAEFGSRRVRVNAVAPGPVYTSAPAERTSALGATTILGAGGPARRDHGAVQQSSVPDWKPAPARRRPRFARYHLVSPPPTPGPRGIVGV